MIRRRHLLLALLVALAVAAPAWGKATPLAGTVGPGFTISLKKAGANVVKLKRGSYTVAVNDRSDFHNFRLRGPGVNRATGVAFVGRRSFTVTLRPGRYTIVCDPHADSMRRTFRVT